jgi:3-hydroxybutyryl-CoA dehydratase
MPYVPRGRYWEEFSVGQRFETARRTVEAADVLTFAGLSGDFNPLHLDAEFARATPFGERVAHGLLTLAISSGQQNQLGLFEGTALAFLGMDRVRFTGPVRFGDTIHTEVTVKEVRETSRPDRGVVTCEVAVRNQRGEIVLTYEASVLMRRRAAPEAPA